MGKNPRTYPRPGFKKLSEWKKLWYQKAKKIRPGLKNQEVIFNTFKSH